MKYLLALSSALIATDAALAASAVNFDDRAYFITVTETSGQSQILVGANETVQFCMEGCFVTLPNGDREALMGTEIIEISGGEAEIRLGL